LPWETAIVQKGFEGTTIRAKRIGKFDDLAKVLRMVADEIERGSDG
jgi:hypothetical protein